MPLSPDHFFVTLTRVGSLWVLLPFWLGWIGVLIYRGQSQDAWLLGVGFGGAVLLVRQLKLLVGRPRPDLLPRLVPMPLDLSFPSAHTAQIAAFCLCLLIMLCRHESGILCWLMGLAGMLLVGGVGLSRLYLQVHYLSDVLAGLFLSMAWVLGAALLIVRIYR